jgi:ATP-dependent DNA helicase MPH1
LKKNPNCRILGLSATPGNKVASLITNLRAAHLEVRDESDPDVKKYLHGKQTDVVSIPVPNYISALIDVRPSIYFILFFSKRFV